MENTGDSLYPLLLRSIIFHAAVFALFALKMVFLPSEGLDFSDAVRVDIVDLPDKISNPAKTFESEAVAPPTEAKPVATPVEAKPVVQKTEPTIDLTEKKKKRSEALRRIKAQEALAGIEDSLKEEANSKKPTYKGNILSPGTELRGLQKNQFDAYLSLINRRIKDNWQLPEWMAKQNLKAHALVMADRQGFVTKKTLVKNSGNKTFDDYVLDAIEKSSPLPPPPEKFTAILEHQGIILAFPD